VLKLPSNDETFELAVKVSFPAKNGRSRTEGEFVAEVKRVDQATIEGWVEDGVYVSDMVDHFLVGVRGIDRGDGVELPPDQAKAAVLKSPEAVQAVRDAFFAAINPSASGRTSSKRRGRG
jgi:hypothetical protein